MIHAPTIGAFIQRVLFSILFIIPGFMHILSWSETVETTAKVFGQGMGATILSLTAVVFLIVGGFSLLFARNTLLGGWMIALFLLGGTYVHYIFASFATTEAGQQIQFAHMMKNIALFGVALRYALGGSAKS